MREIFLQVLEMSLTASWVIAAVLSARLLLCKAPRRYTYWLWLVVLFRLVCPVSFESAVSLVPQNAAQPAQVIRQMNGSVQSVPNSIPLQPPPVEPGAVQTVPAQIPFGRRLLAAVPGLWAAVAALLLVYSLVTLLRLMSRLRQARPLPEYGGNVWQLSAIRSPFVFGLLRPRIYLPKGLTCAEMTHILAHERTHLRRGDHWVKAAAWLAVCLHWFNPLVWVSFFLLEKDMELSCDELAVRHYTAAQKKEYSLTLLQLAAPRRFAMGCPLAFGENNIKSRVKNVLNPKKPALWLIAATVALVAVLSVTLAADPQQAESGSLLPASSESESSAAFSESLNDDGGEGMADGEKHAALDSTFEGNGLTFAIDSNWVVEEQQTEDIRYQKFFDGERELFTYHFGEEWIIQFPTTQESVHELYNNLYPQPREHEILCLVPFAIGGCEGQKLVIRFPQEDLVQLQYCTVVPDALIYKSADNDPLSSINLLSSVDLAQCFVFSCTYSQLPETEALADAIVSSARATQKVIWRGEPQLIIDSVITEEAAVGVAAEEAADWGFAPERGYQSEIAVVDYEGQRCYQVKLTDLYPRGMDAAGWFIACIRCDTGEVLYVDCTKRVGLNGDSALASARKAACAAYTAFLAGDRNLLDAQQWWVPEFHSDGMTYEYLLMDLDGDGVEELLIQMQGEPGGYNGVFHYENGKLLCWNSDAAEMSSRDYPLQSGLMVRQYDYNGTRSYTVFRYRANGEAESVAAFFAREERIPETSTEPCPYYEIDGTEVDQAAFDKQLAEQVTGQLLEGSAWTRMGS